MRAKFSLLLIKHCLFFRSATICLFIRKLKKLKNALSRPQLIKKLEDLETDRNELILWLSQRDKAELTYRPHAYRWNVLEILYHLLLSEAGTLRYIRKKLQYSPNGLPDAGMFSHMKTVVLEWMLTTPVKFKAPAGLDKFPEEPILEKIDADWSASRLEFKKMIEELSEKQLKWQLFKHPIIGRIDMEDTLKFLSAHYHHHKKQIKKLIS